MELKKAREAEEKQKILEEEQKLERRIQEQQERMRLEFEEEQAKKKAKEDAVRHFLWRFCMIKDVTSIIKRLLMKIIYTVCAKNCGLHKQRYWTDNFFLFFGFVQTTLVDSDSLKI